MKIIDTINSFYTELPKEVRRFLYRGLGLFIFWKLLYIFILVPKEIPDQWLIKKLGEGTAATLNWIYNTKDFHAVHRTKLKLYGNENAIVTNSYIYQGSKRAIVGIYKACDGLELMVLASGFILCFYGPWKRKVFFITSVTLGLYFLNLLRCSMLGVIHIKWPQHFEFAHKYIFNLIVYGFAFIMFMLYVSKASLKKQSQ